MHNNVDRGIFPANVPMVKILVISDQGHAGLGFHMWNKQGQQRWMISWGGETFINIDKFGSGAY